MFEGPREQEWAGGRRRGVKESQSFPFLELHRRSRRAQAEQLISLAILDVHQRIQENGVLSLGAGKGDEVQVVADSVQLLRGIHCSPCDVLEQVEAYLRSISSTLNDALGLFLLTE